MNYAIDMRNNVGYYPTGKEYYAYSARIKKKLESKGLFVSLQVLSIILFI